MSRTAFLSTILLACALSCTHVSAQTDTPGAGRAQLSAALREKAEALYGEGKYAEAESSFREAALLASDSARTQAGLCGTRFMLGAYAGAAEACGRVVELQPASAAARLSLGRVLGRLGRNEEAAEELRRAVRLGPDSAPAHEALGVIMLAAGKKDAALEQYRKLQSLGSPLAASLFRLIHRDKILSAQR